MSILNITELPLYRTLEFAGPTVPPSTLSSQHASLGYIGKFLHIILGELQLQILLSSRLARRLLSSQPEDVTVEVL